jgi:hypothetical protein
MEKYSFTQSSKVCKAANKSLCSFANFASLREKTFTPLLTLLLCVKLNSILKINKDATNCKIRINPNEFAENRRRRNH